MPAPLVSRKKLSPCAPDMKTRPCFGSMWNVGNRVSPCSKSVSDCHPVPRQTCGVGLTTLLFGGGCSGPDANDPESTSTPPSGSVTAEGYQRPLFISASAVHLSVAGS